MEIFILKVFDFHFTKNNYFKNKISYLSYVFLSYIYFKKFNKNLNFKHIMKDKNGKPFLKNNEIFFNISHSKNYICIGINNSEIGVDIEENRKINQNAILKFLSEDEINSKISPLKYWTIKEAYSKYLGLGLKLDFKKIRLNSIKKNLYLEELETENFVCCAISKSNLKKINFIDESLIKNNKELNLNI